MQDDLYTGDMPSEGGGHILSQRFYEKTPTNILSTSSLQTLNQNLPILRLLRPPLSSMSHEIGRTYVINIFSLFGIPPIVLQFFSVPVVFLFVSGFLVTLLGSYHCKKSFKQLKVVFVSYFLPCSCPVNSNPSTMLDLQFYEHISLIMSSLWPNSINLPLLFDLRNPPGTDHRSSCYTCNYNH